ncbi:MAG: FdtA/QdtA family cupin domain-containing protein [Thermodesulfobacteriaceae bacterium]|nr:FdtA/QdtA family cupin domain-containing protein [Thermodesulfobacteriaceae bacterium]MCX8041455.1 FdtA/QdtA family cupin domain-containing protein [Thermodesulfobacteriaceae bacterium]MDW8135762.1 FdtA/QdtA family cupin domain-containing protein [Thermodesulfobacterium sp.]
MPWELISLQFKRDERGFLVPLELGRNLPFELKAAFYIGGTKAQTVRGQHAHLKLKELIIALRGEVIVKLEDLWGTKEVPLTHPLEGLLVHPLTWLEIQILSEDCILLVLMDHPYDEKEVLRDYRTFKDLLKIDLKKWP